MKGMIDFLFNMNVKVIIIIILSSFNLSSQEFQDPRMLGLNGSYTNLASGYRAVGINPANLAIYNINTLNDCFKVSEVLKDKKSVNEFIKLLSKASINKIIENRKYNPPISCSVFGKLFLAVDDIMAKLSILLIVISSVRLYIFRGTGNVITELPF